jgi:hypothetical protein
MFDVLSSSALCFYFWIHFADLCLLIKVCEVICVDFICVMYEYSDQILCNWVQSFPWHQELDAERKFDESLGLILPLSQNRMPIIFG